MWRKAYEYVPEAVFLFNAAKAAEKLGNLEQALALAKRAGKEKQRPLPEKLASKNEKLVEDLEARVEFRRKRREVREARKLDWRGWSGMAGLVGGGAALSVGMAVFGQKAQGLNAKLQAAESRDVYERRRRRMEQQQQIGRILLYSGAGVAAAGGGLLIWDLVDVPAMPKRPETALRLGVAGRPGVTIGVSF
jgi:hypothetical protein